MKTLMNLKKIEAYLNESYTETPRKHANRVKKLVAEWEAAMAQPNPVSIQIDVIWKRSRMWGSNPTATARVQFDNGTWNTYTATCGGCGYDKLSTVVASVLNCCAKGALIRALSKPLRGKKVPYGISNWCDGVYPPYFEGGVGMSCYTDGMSNDGIGQFIGGSLKSVSSGDTYDIFTYTAKLAKKKKPTA